MDKIKEIEKAARDVLEVMEKSSSMPLDYVAKQVNGALKELPEDAAIKTLAFVINKRLNNNALSSISKEEFGDIFDDVATLSREDLRKKFAELLPQTATTIKKVSNGHFHATECKPLDIKVSGYEELNSVFDRDVMQKPLDRLVSEADKHLPEMRKYDKEKAKVGKNIVELSFKLAGIDVEAKDIIGDESNIIFCATVDSPVKKHYLFVPTTIKNGDVQWPDGFITDSGIRQITKDDVTDYTNGMDRTFADYSRLNTRASIIDNSLDLPKPLRVLTASLEESLAEVGTSYEKSLVVLGKGIVRNEIEALGYKVNEVKIASEYGDGVIYSASVCGPEGSVKIDVPIEFSNNRPMIPTTFACGDMFQKLNRDSLKSAIASSVEVPNTSYEFSMNVADMNYGELKETMIYSVAMKNYNKVEEILNFVMSKYGAQKHMEFFSDYFSAMKAISKTANSDKCRGCSYFEFAGTKNHMCDFCRKLGMDANKVVKTASGCFRYERIISDETSCFNQGTNIKIGD